MSIAHLFLFLDIHPSSPTPSPLSSWMNKLRSGFENLTVFDLIPALFPHRKHDIDYFSCLGDDPASIRDAFSAVVHSFLSNYYSLEADFKIITTDEAFPDNKPLIVVILSSHTRPCYIDHPPKEGYSPFGWITIPRPGKVVATFRTPFTRRLMKSSPGSFKFGRQNRPNCFLAIFVSQAFEDLWAKKISEGGFIVDDFESQPIDYRLKVPTFEKVLKFRYHPELFPVPAFPLLKGTQEEYVMDYVVADAGPLSGVLGWREKDGSGNVDDIRPNRPELEQFWIELPMMEIFLTAGNENWILESCERVKGWRLCDVVDHRINGIWGVSECPRIEKWRSFVMLKAALPGDIQKDVLYIEILIGEVQRMDGQKVEFRLLGVPSLREIPMMTDEDVVGVIDRMWGQLGYGKWRCAIEEKEKDGRTRWLWVKRGETRLSVSFRFRPAVGMPLISIAFTKISEH
jgi:hypothetical protein